MKIWLIGSPNAGKSTLFNRLIGTYRAIITDIPGTTRDIIQHEASIDGIGDVTVLDSPGLDQAEDELPYLERIIRESDCIVMVVDGKVGMNGRDEAIITLTRRLGKMGQTIVFLNKIDTILNTTKEIALINDYLHLGSKHLVVGSAHHGKIASLLQEIQSILVPGSEAPLPWANTTLSSTKKEKSEWSKKDAKPNKKDKKLSDEKHEVSIEYIDPDLDDDDEDDIDDMEEFIEKKVKDKLPGEVYDENGIPVAIIGRPNVGKSTLINHLTGKALSKVSPIPGTTLDYISATLPQGKKTYTFYDTAGIRRKGQIHGLEKIALDKTYSMLKYFQPVVLFLIDGDEGVTKTDRSLMSKITALNLPTIVVINKIDLLDDKQKKRLLTAVEEHFGQKDRLFTVGISALTGEGIVKIWTIINDLRKRAHHPITTAQLNKIVAHAFIVNPPTFPQSKPVKIYYTTQVKAYPPVFMCFINKKDNLAKSFENWLENQIRSAGNYKWIPLCFLFKDKKMDTEWYEQHLAKRKKAVKERLKRTPTQKIAAKKKAEERINKRGGLKSPRGKI